MMNGKKDLNHHCGTTQGVFYRRQGIFCIISSFALLNNTHPILNKYHLLLGCCQEKIFETCFATVLQCELKAWLILCCSESCFSAQLPCDPFGYIWYWRLEISRLEIKFHLCGSDPMIHWSQSKHLLIYSELFQLKVLLFGQDWTLS